MAGATTTDSVQLLRQAFAAGPRARRCRLRRGTRIHNGLIDKRPAVIARCLHTADVVAAVTTARTKGLRSPFAEAATTSRARRSPTAG